MRSLIRRSSSRHLGVRNRLLLSALPRAPLGRCPALGWPLLDVRDPMRQRTVLYRECAPACCAHAAALGTHAAKGEGQGESNYVPHDDPEPLAACVQAHPTTHTRAKPRPSRPRR